MIVSLYLLRKHKQFCFIILYSICSWLVLLSFSLNVFTKFFLIQKSKSSTKLNQKEWKQEEATIE